MLLLPVRGVCFFVSSSRRHTRSKRDWSSDVCSSDLSSFVYQEVFGLSSVGFSAMFALNAVALLSANSLNIRLVGRIGARRLQRMAVCVIAAGAVAVLLCALVLPRDVDAAMYALAGAVFVATFGVGLNMSNSTALAQGLAADRAGAGSAVLG